MSILPPALGIRFDIKGVNGQSAILSPKCEPRCRDCSHEIHRTEKLKPPDLFVGSFHVYNHDTGNGIVRKSRFSESQIAAALQKAETGQRVLDVCNNLGISEATYYVWRSKYGGLNAAGVQRLRDIEIEHGRLKRMYAELAMENRALRSLIAKKD